MSADQNRVEGNTNRGWTMFLVISIYLIAIFLWRALTPAHEYPMRTEQVMTMGLALLVLVGLIALKTQLSKGKVLFWVALIAGVGLFAIRLTGNASWWTGHLMFAILPR